MTCPPRFALLLALLAVSLPAAAQPKDFGFSEIESVEETLATTSVTEKLQQLSLRERIAQMMLITLEGLRSPAPNDRAVLEQYTPGGVYLRSVVQPGSVPPYIKELRSNALVRTHGIPLFIGTNLYDLPESDNLRSMEFIQLPTLLATAAAADTAATEKLGELLAHTLTELGFNLHLGPSLELGPELEGAAGSVRNLGSDPRFVATAGTALLRAFDDAGVAAVAMGFPGGGLNKLDRTPPVLLTPPSLAPQREWFPYHRAIDQGVDIIHVANTLVPTMATAGAFASLSPAVIRDTLRHEMQFQGVVLAGPVDGPFVGASHTASEAAILAILAGADMLLWNSSGVRVMKSIEDIVLAVQQGLISEETINSSVTRILALKEQKDLSNRPLPDEKSVVKAFKESKYPGEAYEVERRSITVAQNRGNLLPLNKEKAMPIGITGVVGVEELHDALEEYMQPIAMQVITTAKHTGDIMDFEIARIADRVQGIRTAVCIFSDGVRIESQVRLIRRLRARGINVVVVSLGYPRHLPDYAIANAIVVAYGTERFFGGSMKAVADVLIGQGPVGVYPPALEVAMAVGEERTFDAIELVRSPTGRLPVTVDSYFEAGLGLPYDPTYAIKRVRWNFGDGTRSRSVETDHTFDEPGRYPVTLEVEDRRGFETSGAFHVNVE